MSATTPEQGPLPAAGAALTKIPSATGHHSVGRHVRLPQNTPIDSRRPPDLSLGCSSRRRYGGGPPCAFGRPCARVTGVAGRGGRGRLPCRGVGGGEGWREKWKSLQFERDSTSASVRPEMRMHENERLCVCHRNSL